MNIFRAIFSDFKRRIINDQRGFIQTLLPLLAKAAPYALSLGGSYLSNKSNKKQQSAGTIYPKDYDPRNPEKRQVDSFLANYISKYGSMYQPGKPYAGKLSAGISPFESRGLEQFLNEYLNTGVSSQTGDVRNLLNKTITGGFDPKTSPYYQAFRDEANYNRKGAIDRTRADLGARGKFFSSEAIDKEGDINAQTGIGLNKVMADLVGQERDRSMSAVPYAAGLEEYLSGIPLQKAGAATTLGALPRQLEQDDLEREYQDFKRQQSEYQGVINQAGSISGRPVEPYAPQPVPILSEGANQSPTSSFLQNFLGNYLNRSQGGSGSSGDLIQTLMSLLGGK